MNPILQHIQDHWAAYGTVGTTLGISGIQNMPPPGTPLTWGTIYKWFFDTLQTALPLRRPTTPVAPAIQHPQQI